MNESRLSFFARLALAFGVFFRTVSDSGFAVRVRQLRGGEAHPAEGQRPTESAPPSFKAAAPDAALQLLGLLQQEGRFIDFLKENVSAFSDQEIGAAARVIHDGCHKVLSRYFVIEPIRDEQEGSRVTLREGFDSSSVRLVGNVLGKPPFTGNLVHRGWRVTGATLPRLAEGHDTSVLAAAEVEL